MNDNELLRRITVNPKIMVGKAVIKGTRLTVDHILNRMAHGDAEADILREYPRLTLDDIKACLLFATKSLQEASFVPLAMESV